jgi:hypothetical protein
VAESPDSLPAGERRTLVVSAFLVLLTRLPWLGHDYGSDPDSYRVVGTARTLLHGGVYEPSRLPGYPAYEFLTVLTADAPPWASNLVTALFSGAAFLLMALLLRQLQVRRYLLLALGFVMVPVVYISSCCTMDYLPSMTLGLGAAYALFRQRPLLAGVLLGLSTGCRLTASVMALPLCLWIWLEADWRPALRTTLRFGLAALAVAALSFLPVWRIYGAGFFTFFDNDGYPPLGVVLARSTTLVWGAVGSAALLLLWCGLPWYRRHAGRRLQDPRRRHTLIVALVSITLYLVAFLRLPDEAGYLVPLVPWLVVASAIVAPPMWGTGLAVALLLSPWGAMVEDHQVRESQDVATRAVIAAVSRLPGRGAVVCGWVLPRVSLAIHGDRLGEHLFIYLIEDQDDYQHYVHDGRQIYYLPGVDLYESQAHQLELAEMGAHELPVPRERQRPASTGE